MRPYRHRVARIWLLVVLSMLSVVVPVAALTSPGPVPLLPAAMNLAAVGICFAVAVAVLPLCRSVLAEDLVTLLPCLALLVGGAIDCVMGSPAGFDRHQTFHDVTICSALIFLGAAPRVHVVLVASALSLMIVSGVLAHMPRGGLLEDGVFWTIALLAFSWGGRVQERGRLRLYMHRVEREAQLRRVSALSNGLFRGARTDALTGVGNRLQLDERLARLASSGESLRDFWLLMVDVDHFKQLNDALGHVVGDAALRTIATTLASCLRQDDMLARYGGEEFAALVRAPEATHAWRIAERMRQAVADLPLSNPRTEAGHVTVSIGLAAIGPGGLGSVIARADLALYAAKGSGRDRVAIEPGFERTGYPLPGMALSAI